MKSDHQDTNTSLKLNNNQLANAKKFLIPTFFVLMMGCVIPNSVFATTIEESSVTRSTGTMIDDENIEHLVNKQLSEQIPKGSFTVVSYGKKVLLTGQVPNKMDRDKAKSIADNIQGVKGVWNYLSVGANENAGNITNDAYLTSLAKTRFIAQKDVNTNNIKIVTSNKIVYLLGYDVGKPSQVRAAVSGVKSIDGVHGVVNLIGK
ncbi:MAG: BON domain-containing protein [Burkholderiales bacterium]|nr:BON domain-containing protein [Burkholderiales bacterium]